MGFASPCFPADQHSFAVGDLRKIGGKFEADSVCFAVEIFDDKIFKAVIAQRRRHGQVEGGFDSDPFQPLTQSPAFGNPALAVGIQPQSPSQVFGHRERVQPVDPVDRLSTLRANGHTARCIIAPNAVTNHPGTRKNLSLPVLASYIRNRGRKLAS